MTNGAPKLCLTAFAALLIAQAAAQESSLEAPARPETEPQHVVDEIIVRGRRLEEIENDLRLHVREFIDEVVATPIGRGFARWHRSVCVGVHNLEPSAAQYIVDRISSLALDVGLEPGEPGCSPDVTIVFATNASEAASAMVDNDRRVFMRVGGLAGMDLGRAALEEFVKSEKAVRWWHVSLPVDAHTGLPAIELLKTNCGQALCAPQVKVQGPSRVHNGTRDDLQYVIILVDATKLRGTTWQQLGDYLAVISLAQIDQRSSPAAFDSILNLFSNPAAYSGLTDWDRSYVRALYALDQERIAPIQKNEIVSRIAKRELDGAR
ncbi:MAG TPA: hypothetical protein VNA66_10640 [Gammaproteobacteria bacterium]|nr:hypothetical protein [Gammaproteobacteria bacterium]